MTVIELRGDPEHHEGALLLTRRDALVVSMALPIDACGAASGDHGLELHRVAAWEATRREFDHPAEASQWMAAVREAATFDEDRSDITNGQLLDRVDAELAGVATERRIARWVLADRVQRDHALLMGAERTVLRIGGLPHWHQPRPVPRDPDTLQPMVCLAQFAGLLDPHLPGGDAARYFVFGPAVCDGGVGRYTVLWQAPNPHTDTYVCLDRPGEPPEFATVALDLIQRDPEELIRHDQDLYHRVTMVWRGPRGGSGHVATHGFEGDLIRIQHELITTVTGLEDEGFRTVSAEELSSPWLIESLSRMMRMAGQPETIDAETFLHGRDSELLRLHGGYLQTTNAPYNPIADDLIARLWPGLGGEPQSLTRRVRAEGVFGEGEMLPIFQFDEEGPFDHPHVSYGDQGLATVFVPARPVVVAGLVLLQSF